ncbi:MAG: cation:proton antiporter [Chloroherpetonaceae bacterium]|nr:cation:proton antiporter [Chloroherpetonaceae bacterium]MDW8437664.1 cation:proton antiporter [Chloroherpetonaceae bacterium]
MRDADLLSAIAISVIAATLVAFIARFARLPLLVAYIAAGALIGDKIGFGWIHDEAQIERVSEIGLILLLFIIGLEIDLKKLFKAGKAVLLTGGLQVPACFAISFGALALAGFAGGYDLIYLAFCLSLSSTMIVVKTLYDKREIDTLAGRVTLGILVIQDIWAILFIAIQPNLDRPEAQAVLLSFAEGVGLVAACLLASRYLLPKFFHSIAKLPEFMLVASLAWCFAVSGAAQLAGLSKEMGALIAGVSISTFPYNLDVVAKVINIRDFFITLFLVALGMKIPKPTAETLLVGASLSAILIVSRFVSVFPTLRALGLGNRVAIISSINLSQISEFALVIGALGASCGHISDATVSYLVFALVITATLSTFWIEKSHESFLLINDWLAKIGLREPLSEEERTGDIDKQIFILGFHKIASSLLYEIEKSRSPIRDKIRVIDFNPETLQKLREKGIDAQYGDISHIETLHHLGIRHARIVVSTIPDSLLKGASNLNILKAIKAHAPEAKTIMTSEDLQTTIALYEAGADYVLMPRLRAASNLLEMIERASSWSRKGTETLSYKEFKARSEILD